MLNESSI